MIKNSVSNSIAIKVVAPEGFNISGNTEVKPEEISEKDVMEDIIVEVVEILNEVDKQRNRLRGIITKLKKIYPCKNCG
jgi:hypothetical protein